MTRSPSSPPRSASRPAAAGTAAPVFPDERHDHRPCLATAIANAEAAFAKRQMRLTELRRRVFEEIASSHSVVGAYDILERLAARDGSRLAPISVYRAIDALLEAGVVHRVESRNAFFACHVAHAPNTDVIVLVCDTCRQVAEVDGSATHQALARAVRAAEFTPRRTVVEVEGQCAACAPAGRAGPGRAGKAEAAS